MLENFQDDRKIPGTLRRFFGNKGREFRVLTSIFVEAEAEKDDPVRKVWFHCSHVGNSVCSVELDLGARALTLPQ